MNYRIVDKRTNKYIKTKFIIRSQFDAMKIWKKDKENYQIIPVNENEPERIDKGQSIVRTQDLFE